jgi:hypothetical protein
MMRAAGVFVLAALAVQAPVAHKAPHGRVRSNAEDRLVKGLKLDRAQEAEVRRALQWRRDAIRRLLDAPVDPDVPRVAAIQAITDRTSERIRAVLSDEQKKLYGQALPRKDLAAAEGKPDVEQWLNALRKGR